MSDVTLPLIGAIAVSLIGLYFVRKNFRTARQTGAISIGQASYSRADSEGWFKVAYWINWFIGGIFAALGVTAIGFTAALLLGNM